MSSNAPDDATPAHRYTADLAQKIEAQWQGLWEERGTFFADNPAGDLAGPLAEQRPFYLLDMFPYPSGKGLHVGHPLGYIATDVVGRYQRMQGANVLYTLGYDAFGLPAEQYAIATGQHPRVTTMENIATMAAQLRRLGLSHDSRRVFATTDDDYVKWTQWIFLQIFNSWFDPQAPRRDGHGVGAARPISELISSFEDGTRELPEDVLGSQASSLTWAQLSTTQRAEVIDSYRLAFASYAPVNWCPGLGTVLANEEVTAEGRSERGNFPVFKSRLRQWMMRITAYADRLNEDLDTIDWPEKVRSMQRHWIGKSHGATVRFVVPEGNGREERALEVFTTRPDTLFGATFMVVAPEHDLVGGEDAPENELTVPNSWPEGTRDAWTGGYATPREAVAAYRKAAAAKSDDERSGDDATEKTGVFTGIYGRNPVNGTMVPIFIADYVLMGYGTGAIMAVPAHDERDYAFAKKFDLDIVATITPEGDHDLEESAWVGDGVICNSANDHISINGMNKEQAIATMIEWLGKAGLGEETYTYRLRDWLFSRQRYWGEPFPVVYDKDGVVHALPESMLPVTLPDLDNFNPRTFDPDDADTSPEPPLGRATEWTTVDLDLGDGRGVQTYTRDTNTMPNWAGSCWYEIRYADPHNENALVGAENEKYWMGPRTPGASGGVDLYVGGVEHAVLHLLYARFWHKVLFDLGHVSSSEPFHKLFNQGYVQAYAYTDERGQYVPADEVEGDEDQGFTWQGQPVNREYGKMGKSLKNIVTPDDMCDAYGADTFRLYEMSMGPLDVSRPWETRAVVGSQRFLQRLWRNIVDENTGELSIIEDAPDLQTAKLLAHTINDVTEEYDNMRVNTAIAKMIAFNNHLTSLDKVPRQAAEELVLMLAPIAPHICEELWKRMGHQESLARASFPTVTDPKLLEADAVTCIVQVKGKVKAKLEVSPSVSAEELEELALQAPVIVKILDGKPPRRVIVKPPSLVNVVPAE
ncbi:MAG: class I tRNA ligase family protein [Actinomycetaceae bacterium]|nr:class I tRNA ligase family protein [Actinomycetaceae bacterium]